MRKRRELGGVGGRVGWVVEWGGWGGTSLFISPTGNRDTRRIECRVQGSSKEDCRARVACEGGVGFVQMRLHLSKWIDRWMGCFGISVTDFIAFIVLAIYASDIEAKRGNFWPLKRTVKKVL